MKDWGKCSVELHKDVLIECLSYPFFHSLRVNKAVWTGEEEFYQCEISSMFLEPGYHGQLFIIIYSEDEVLLYRFKKDTDT